MNNSITVGITAYREGNFLNDAIKSVLKQSSINWSGVLVLDGNSDSSTKNIFNSFEHKKFVKFSFGENQGPYGTRKKAIELTKTKWYFHLDGDDKLPEDSLKHIIEVIKKNKDAEFVYGSALYFNKKNSFTRFPYKNIEILCQKPLFIGQSPITKKLYNKMGGFSNELRNNNDWDFWISVHENNIKGVQVDNIIYERRIRKGSVGSFYSSERVNNVRTIIRRHPKFFNQKNRTNKALFKVFELKARSEKANGNRLKAIEYAENAIKHGSINKSIGAIYEENNMNFIHYKIRRFKTFLRKIFEN